MFHDVKELRVPAVMIKAPLRVGPEPLERCGPVALVRGTVCLEVVSRGGQADLRRGMHVPARLGEEGEDMAGGALCLATEQGLASGRCCGVEFVRRRSRRLNGELIELQGRKLG